MFILDLFLFWDIFCLFWFFRCYPFFFGIFLSFCYIFLLVSSIFFDFVVFSFQFTTHFAKIPCSCFAYLMCFFNFTLVSLPSACCMILRFCGLFLSIGYMLLSFRCNSSCRFYADSMFSFDFTAFWFHFARCCLVRNHKQSGKLDSQCPPGKVNFGLHFDNCFGDCSPCLLHSPLQYFLFHDWFTIISIVSSLFTRQIWQQHHTQATTNNEKQPETTSCDKPCRTKKQYY